MTAPGSSLPPTPDHTAPPQGATPPPSEAPPGQGPASPDSKIRSLTPAGLLAGGAAAATASVIGGQLGVAGTMIGTFLTSVVSAAALALYSDSIARGKRALRTVGSVVQTRAPLRSTSRTRPEVAAAAAEQDAAPLAPEDEPSRRPLVLRIVLLAIVMAAVGIGAVFLIQRASGTELSHGTGTIQRSVTGDDAVAPRSDTPQDRTTDGPSNSPSDAPGSDPSTAPGTDPSPTSGADGSAGEGGSTGDSGATPSGQDGSADGTGNSGTGDSGSGGSGSNGSGGNDSGSGDSGGAAGGGTGVGGQVPGIGSNSGTGAGSGSGSGSGSGGS